MKIFKQMKYLKMNENLVDSFQRVNIDDGETFNNMY